MDGRVSVFAKGALLRCPGRRVEEVTARQRRSGDPRDVQRDDILDGEVAHRLGACELVQGLVILHPRPPGSDRRWGFNTSGDRAWVVEEEGIDLTRIVAEVAKDG